MQVTIVVAQVCIEQHALVRSQQLVNILDSGMVFGNVLLVMHPNHVDTQGMSVLVNQSL